MSEEEKISKNVKMTPEKEMEILRKIEKLMKLQAMLKDPRLNAEDYDEDELEALLTKAELFEEALKNYMYQFGMSLYQNKEGKNYFKKFFDDYEDVRDATELDRHSFSPKSKEPNWLEKIMEHVPEDKIFLNNNDIEKVVLDLCERDGSMLDILEKTVDAETNICNGIYKNRQKMSDNNTVQTMQNEQTMAAQEKEVPLKEDAIVLVESVEELPIAQEDVEDLEEWQDSFECGEDKQKLPKLPKIKKIRRLPQSFQQEKPIKQIVVKDNINNR